MTLLTYLWLAIIAAAACVEIAALVNKQPGDTLSEHVWRWFAVRDPRRQFWAGFRRTILLITMVWLTAHFVTGGRL
jgi:hypothetical protein